MIGSVGAAWLSFVSMCLISAQIFIFFILIHYCALRETWSHVTLRVCVSYCVCNVMYECYDNSVFFPHSMIAIDTQRNYYELAGAIYSCQMAVMPVAIRVPLGLL